VNDTWEECWIPCARKPSVLLQRALTLAGNDQWSLMSWRTGAREDLSLMAGLSIVSEASHESHKKPWHQPHRRRAVWQLIGCSSICCLRHRTSTPCIKSGHLSLETIQQNCLNSPCEREADMHSTLPSELLLLKGLLSSQSNRLKPLPHLTYPVILLPSTPHF
jgi:hypothetical protein